MTTRSAIGMTLQEAIDRRRSVRAYRPGSLDRSAIDALLQAAVRAPTAMHAEPWAFVVIQDRDALRRLSDRAKPLFVDEVRRAHLDRGGHALHTFERPEFNVFYDAGTLIVIGVESHTPFAEADCWLAAENLMLAACAMGLGSCVIGSAVAALNFPDVKLALGIPEAFLAIAPIIVGTPAQDAPATGRRPARIVAWR
ncbi:MAG: nitroreductase family protein [Candidatus Levyibacteriota bacterium]